MKVFVALCLLSVTMAMPQVAFPNADIIKNAKLGIQHPNQDLIDKESRIVGGSSVSIDKHPWQASLQYQGSHICGASLVSDRWLITAAHCYIGNSQLGDYTVVVGTTSLSESEHRHTLKKRIPHADYNKGQGTYPNDIALLELDSPVTSTVAKTITIANEGSKFEEQNCVISGWGRLSGGGSVPDDLQAVNMTVLSNSECSSAWRSNILDSQVCVHLRFGYSACNGDSGGPLVCGNTLVGATSWGSSTCSGTYPSVYTRVSSFRDWMRQQAGI